MREDWLEYYDSPVNPDEEEINVERMGDWLSSFIYTTPFRATVSPDDTIQLARPLYEDEAGDILSYSMMPEEVRQTIRNLPPELQEFGERFKPQITSEQLDEFNKKQQVAFGMPHSTQEVKPGRELRYDITESVISPYLKEGMYYPGFGRIPDVVKGDLDLGWGYVFNGDPDNIQISLPANPSVLAHEAGHVQQNRRFGPEMNDAYRFASELGKASVGPKEPSGWSKNPMEIQASEEAAAGMIPLPVLAYLWEQHNKMYPPEDNPYLHASNKVPYDYEYLFPGNKEDFSELARKRELLKHMPKEVLEALSTAMNFNVPRMFEDGSKGSYYPVKQSHFNRWL